MNIVTIKLNVLFHKTGFIGIYFRCFQVYQGLLCYNLQQTFTWLTTFLWDFMCIAFFFYLLQCHIHFIANYALAQNIVHYNFVNLSRYLYSFSFSLCFSYLFSKDTSVVCLSQFLQTRCVWETPNSQFLGHLTLVRSLNLI